MTPLFRALLPVHFLAGLFLLTAASPALAVEQAAYKVVRADGDFEIRDYPRLKTAYTVQKGARDDVGNSSFRRLADYIFDRERPEGKIAMTAPVFMSSSGAQNTSMEFVMPRRFDREALPKPKDKRVKLGSRPPKRVAAIRFNGWADDDDLAEKEQELRAWMAKKGLKAGRKVEWAFYNPPWTLGPWRRNEVLIEVRR